MRIGFDVSQTAEHKAGCGFVADQLIRHLVRYDTQNEYILYPTFYSYCSSSYTKSTKPHSHNCRRYFEGMTYSDMVRGWETKMDDRTGWLGNPDIVHSNNFSCVKDHNAKIVYTLYDVVPIVHPEFTTEENRLVCFDGLFNASIHADHCIAISHHTKKSFLSFFPSYPEERITVARLGTRPSIAPVKDESVRKKVLRKFSLDNDFWLGVGTIEPRKNYRLLMEAYAALNDPRPLVIAGGRGWLESDMKERVNALGMQNSIRFLGYVSDEELSVLYSSCFAFVYPSLYEGFGLPVLEAMSCGAAVITSNTSSLPEVGGDAVEYIDPQSKESLMEKMRLLNENEEVLRRLRLKSPAQAKKFSWAGTAEIVKGIYDKVHNT